MFLPFEKRSKGSILLVMLVSCLLLLVVLALATMSSVNINLIRSQVEYAQAILTAQAAAAQLLYELDEFELVNNKEIDLSSTTFDIMDLRDRYSKKPVFIVGENHMTGKAYITFNESEPFYSTDNSMSEYASKGWRDRNRDSVSVPSFAIDLIITVKSGGSIRHFEAIITRKWPYAGFCTRGPIVITATGIRQKQKSQCAPSSVKGDLLSLFDPQSVRKSLKSDGHSSLSSANLLQPIASSESMFNYGNYYSQIDPARLPLTSISIGGEDANDKGNTLIGDACTAAKKPRLTADPPYMNSRNSDPIVVGINNTHQGKKRYGILLGSVSWDRDPLSFINFPDKKDFEELDPRNISGIEIMDTASSLNMEEGTLKWTGSLTDLRKFLIKIGDCSMSVGGSASSTPISRLPVISDMRTDNKPSIMPVLDPEKAKEKFPEIKEEIELLQKQNLSLLEQNRKLYELILKHIQGDQCFMKDDIILTGSSRSNKFYLKGTLTNHRMVMEYVPGNSTGGQNSYSASSSAPSSTEGTNSSGNGYWKICEENFSKAGLVLKDCSLYVEGDVELGEFSVDSEGFISTSHVHPSHTSKLEEATKSIEGDNATLIVNGNVKLVGGKLDSKDKGMVMHSKNIELSTKGNYRGLILAQGAIVINPYPVKKGKESTEINQLHIIGAIASRGEVVNEEEEVEDQNGKTSNINNSHLEGLVLKSLILDFDPRYAKVLHRFGRPRISVWQEIK